MKGIISKAFVVTLLCSQVAAFGMQSAAVQAAKSVLTKEAVMGAVAGAKQVVTKVVTHPSVIQASQFAKMHADKGIALAKQGFASGVAYAQPYAAKGAQFAGKVAEKAATLAVQHKNEVMVGGFAAGSAAATAGAVAYAHKDAAAKAAEQAAIKAAQEATQKAVQATGNTRDALVASAKAVGSWIASTRVAQVIAATTKQVAASRPAQLAAQGAHWTLKSMKAHPDNWLLGGIVGFYAGCAGYILYKDYQRRANYRNRFQAE